MIGVHARRWVELATPVGRAARLLLYPLLFSILAAAPAAAFGSEEIAAAQQAKISMKVLSFDSSLKERPGQRFVIGVVYDPASSRSAETASAMVAAFNALGRTHTLHRKTVSALALAFDGDLSRAISAADVSVLYVSTGLMREISSIAAIATDKRLPTMCGSRQQLEQGLAFAVIEKGGRPAIVVNLSVAMRVGLRLDPKLLRLAELIK